MAHQGRGQNRSVVGLASLAVVAGGALWGLFWIPVRALEDLGLSGAWPGLVVYAVALTILGPIAAFTARPTASLRDLAVLGLLTGAAFAFYSTAIILTDVLRAILFFYLTPIWGTLIGLVALEERLTPARVLAILLALAGLVAVIGFGNRSSLNLGDGLALASGMLWAVGSYRIYRLPPTGAVPLSVAFLMGSIVVTLVLIFLGGESVGPPLSAPPMGDLWPFALLSGLFAVPMILLTLWPASFLSPGRMGILLMSEVVVGVASVALLAGDPFGPPEAVGSLLILAASLTEVLGNRA